MLIQVPAATKIVGLILCGVLMLGNAANNVVSIFSNRPEVIDIGSHYEIITPTHKGAVIVYIRKITKLGIGGCTIVNNHGETVKYWLRGNDLNNFCNSLTTEEKKIYDKYAKLIANKESYQKLLNECKSHTSEVKVERKNSYVRGSYRGYEFSGRVFDRPSDMGIDGGRISKLTIMKDGAIEINYDRGWDIEPTQKNLAAYLEIIGKLEYLK